ncbi:hypothetical protein BBJ29_009103 [Phytophthora kernoviae]|uniref:Uncharacterized protein n=1 Tax=Phytophthora kernoviae TaxID=325452 RepID=A0A421FW48_9STRA|nr:hypothetical protein BBJ29_009103 [Phytophthora kernoviae]
MKEQLTELEAVKVHLDAEVALLRRKLRGVNAVRENDVAVAHCSSIMQHRLSKAEEEFMKLVTQQQEAKIDVDRVRHELLSLRKVRHKLQTDIEDVAQANQAFEEKIHATKFVRNQLSEGLSELEHQAEMELEEQKINLPPEDAVVVDVAKLMSAVQERNVTRRHAYSDGIDANLSVTLAAFHPSVGALSPGSNIDKTPLRKGIRRGSAAETPKSLLDHSTAFRVLQNSLGFTDLATFEQHFTTAEEQLLSKYKANLALTDELASLEKELLAVNTEKKANRANVRGIMQANEKVERDMQTRIQATLRNIRSYNELREQRNREHTRLRNIMVRCLEALQIDARSSKLSDDDANSVGRGSTSGSSGGSIGHTLHLSEMPSPELLEMLQRKMTQVAVTMKVKHSSHMLELPPEALRLNRGHDGRRSNMFSTREVSKIVLGPREPSGSALLSILGTAQAPSVDAAMALTENLGMVEVMRGLHRATSPARRRASSLSVHPPVMGKLNGAHNNAGSTSPEGLVLPDTGSTEARKSNLNHMYPGGHGLLATRSSLAVMTEADKEDEDEDEDESGDPLNDEQSNDNNIGNDDIESTEDDGDELDALVP